MSREPFRVDIWIPQSFGLQVRLQRRLAAMKLGGQQRGVFGVAAVLSAVLPRCAGLVLQGARAPVGDYPVSRVVALLRDMKTNLEKEADTEQETYEKLACWCTSGEKEKSKSITDGEAHLAELQAGAEHAAPPGRPLVIPPLSYTLPSHPALFTCRSASHVPLARAASAPHACRSHVPRAALASCAGRVFRSLAAHTPLTSRSHPACSKCRNRPYRNGHSSAKHSRTLRARCPPIRCVASTVLLVVVTVVISLLLRDIEVR